ncbi:beta-galactosidase 2-like [Iris pallida]|uniref:Beta-galactosidase 2-like n=1 Tax=Iris pallida TaxID=29817 RepID=A0AAX6G5J5_IRIPA|nr:beta-galactosidase 2-like [Iris pallida]KAJ6847299.1 beta-galactosidase 2-like [Iris pallida]
MVLQELGRYEESLGRVVYTIILVVSLHFLLAGIVIATCCCGVNKTPDSIERNLEMWTMLELSAQLTLRLHLGVLMGISAPSIICDPSHLENMCYLPRLIYILLTFSYKCCSLADLSQIVLLL